MNEKASSPISNQKKGETGDFINQIVTFAFVCRGPIKSIDDIASYIDRFTDSQVVYRKASVGKLLIVEK